MFIAFRTAKISSRSAFFRQFYILMVFKIRDKSLFWTVSGWKNNYAPKVLNMPKPIATARTHYVTCRYDYHSYLRMYQSYRNYSRTIKQYLHGDTKFEEILILELREMFKIPYKCQTPVELIKYGAERRMADQLDRDYEIISHNYHPAQLSFYNLRNKHIRKDNQQADLNEKGEKTPEQILKQEVDLAIKEEQAKLSPGEKVSLEKITEIFMRIRRSMRGKTGTRNEDGEIDDFLEKRRPFMEPKPDGHSH